MTNYDKLSPLIKDKIDNFFIRWLLYNKWSDKNFQATKPNIVIDNYKKDHFLKVHAFEDITNFIIKSTSKGVEDILINIRKYIRENHHFKGGIIKIKPTIVGTVTIKMSLFSHLSKNYKSLFPRPEDIELFFAKEPNDYDHDEILCSLKPTERQIWLTWDENDSTQSPFSFSNLRDKDEICKALGLSEIYFNMDTLLVLFKLDTNQDLKRPTIADANFDNDLWRPTDESFKRYGLTNPISPLVLTSSYYPKRPEAVVKSEYLNFRHLYKKLDNHE